MIKIWIRQNVIAYVTTSTYNYGETWDYYKCSDELIWFG
jgi:hypothetical protein